MSKMHTNKGHNDEDDDDNADDNDEYIKSILRCKIFFFIFSVC